MHAFQKLYKLAYSTNIGYLRVTRALKNVITIQTYYTVYTGTSLKGSEVE